MKRLSLPHYVSRSGSKFESTENFLSHSTVVDTNKEHLESVGIPIAQIDHDTYATTKDELHCFIIGESGCGKTRRVILPTIRLMSKSGESMLISDPKGELYKYTADSLRKKGYEVIVLNFRKPRCGNRWNPLGMIEKLYRSGIPENADKANMMIGDVVSILADGITSSDDPYWGLSAISVFRGVTQIILDYGKDGDLTFENIALTARAVRSSLKTEEFKRFIDNLPANSSIVQNLSVIITNADTTRNCIMSMFESMISMYCNQELLKDLFAVSEFDIASLGKKPTALFFILPDDSEAMYPIATYFIEQVYSALIELADEQPDGKLPNKVTFLLDEFANFAKMPSMHSMLTAARSRRIRFVLVCQSMDQLIKKYETAGMEILLSNCRVWVYMSCRNLPFLRRLEELAGNYISPYTNVSIPLIDIGSLQHFEMGQILVLNDRCRPLIGFLDDYSKYDFGADGPGQLIELPDPHEIIQRQLFDLKTAYKKSANSWNFTEVKEQKTFDGTRRAKKEPTVPERAEDQYALAREVIEMVEKVNDSTKVLHKNNLAFIIRYCKLDTSKLSASFSLDVCDLLREGVDMLEPFSVMNQALYFLEKKQYMDAGLLLSKLGKKHYRELKKFWFDSLWKNDRAFEGALVSTFAQTIGVISDEDMLRGEDVPLETLQIQMKLDVKFKFPGFVGSVYYTSLIEIYRKLASQPEDE